MVRRDEGASTVEYAFLVFAIAVAVVLAATSLGGVVNDLFSKSTTCVESHVQASCT